MDNWIGSSKSCSDLSASLICFYSLDLYFRSHQRSMMKLFCKNSQSYMFDRVTNTPLQSTTKTMPSLWKFLTFCNFVKVYKSSKFFILIKACLKFTSSTKWYLFKMCHLKYRFRIFLFQYSSFCISNLPLM